MSGIEDEADRLVASCPSCGKERARRLVGAYGTRARELVAGVADKADWGRDFGAGLSERELSYLVDREWARTAEDVLWRRSKLGLRLKPAEAADLENWMQTSARPAATPAV